MSYMSRLYLELIDEFYNEHDREPTEEELQKLFENWCSRQIEKAEQLEDR